MQINQLMLGDAQKRAAELEGNAILAQIETYKAQRNHALDRVGIMAAELARATGLCEVYVQRNAALEAAVAELNDKIALLEIVAPPPVPVTVYANRDTPADTETE